MYSLRVWAVRSLLQRKLYRFLTLLVRSITWRMYPCGLRACWVGKMTVSYDDIEVLAMESILEWRSSVLASTNKWYIKNTSCRLLFCCFVLFIFLEKILELQIWNSWTSSSQCQIAIPYYLCLTNLNMMLADCHLTMIRYNIEHY